MIASADFEPELCRILEARHHDPFSVLGRHPSDRRTLVRTFIPGAAAVSILTGDARLTMRRRGLTDLFEWQGPAGAVPERYELEWVDGGGARQRRYDPYCFPPQIPDFDLHLFGEGRHWHAYRMLGAHPHSADGVAGILFATWAPNAERVSVVGDFNAWDGRCHCMRVRGGSGVWELFVPGLAAGVCYKFELRSRDGGAITLKTDPYGTCFERRPGTAALVCAEDVYGWHDAQWLARRREGQWLHQPMTVLEVHLGSWRRDGDGGFLNYRELAQGLASYARELGFTHIELLPITEHPLDGSWGYQTTGYFAPTSRFGTPDDFRYFVDHCHQHGVGVLLDWVPGHFPKDAHALARFDGSALYEHEDPRLGEHRDWGTLIFNYGRNEVKNFLLASALYWLEEFHLDGLRVDAVASMLYLDYSRGPGEWLPNVHGGRENLEAIAFLREMNRITHERHPGTVIIAEESTSWPLVSRPVWLGGLGFSMKWNMGWMHDTLAYMGKDPIFRRYHHDLLTFGLLYAFNENYVLSFSHDEVVHLKRSLLGKMAGDDWQCFANLRLLYAFQYTQPGKKLLFMGSEFAQGREWSHDQALAWHLLEHPQHRGVQKLIADLNRLYSELPALHFFDFDARGFAWIDCDDAAHSLLAYRRLGPSPDQQVVVICNFTPVPRPEYRVGVAQAGEYREVLNSDSAYYGGSNLGNAGHLRSEPVAAQGHAYSLRVTIPPLAALILQYQPAAAGD